MFLRPQFFISMAASAAVTALGMLWQGFYVLGLIMLSLTLLAAVADVAYTLLVRVSAVRHIASKLDMGDLNTVRIDITLSRPLLRPFSVIDELPPEFRMHLEAMQGRYDADSPTAVGYTFRPLQRGRYTMGRTLVFITLTGMVERRAVAVARGTVVEVYPSYSHLREKEQAARTQMDNPTGTKRTRQRSNNTEFADIREYVPGDDIRTVNWRATARAGRTMVNNYEDERAQTVYNIIDCGRAMHRTFDGLTLQDHAINASLLMSYSAITGGGDLAGIATYGPGGSKILPARNGDAQLLSIMKHLYALSTDYGDGDLEQLCLSIDRQIQRPCLMVLHTDYATMDSMQRQLPLLQRLSRRHCVVVVLFADHELEALASGTATVATGPSATDPYDLIRATLASDLVLQKRQMAIELQRQGIHCILTEPRHLSGNLVRKYLSLKSQNAW